MFDVAPTELLLVAFVALVVIGPKDLPKTLRVVGGWVGRARSVARQFRSGFDAMVREAELEEMEKSWAKENARIMSEHPPVQPGNGQADDHQAADPAPSWDDPSDGTPPPAMVERPVIAPDEPVPAATLDRPDVPPVPDVARQPVMVDDPHVEPTEPSHAAPEKPDGVSS